MMDGNEGCLRRKLQQIIEATPAAGVKGGGFWVGDKAEERRVLDDVRAGRLSWWSALQHARRGLDALDLGNEELASAFLEEAQRLRAAAIEARMKPADYADLGSSARPRGQQPRTAGRDARLAAAVAAAAPLVGKSARLAALAADPELAEAFKGMGDAAIRAAVRRGEKL